MIIFLIYRANVANWIQERLYGSKITHCAKCTSWEETYIFCFLVLCCVYFITLLCFWKSFSSYQSRSLGIYCSRFLHLEEFSYMQILCSRGELFPLRICHSIGCYDHRVDNCSQADQNHQLVLGSLGFLFDKLYFMKIPASV